MSLITQCPACATMFRVVPDQLRVSEGWVRCGQCDEVFDANAHLQQHDPLAPPAGAAAQPNPLDTPASPAPEPEPAPGTAPQASQPPPSDGYDWGPVLAPQAPDGPPAHAPAQQGPLEEPVLYAHPGTIAAADASDDLADAFLAHNPHGLPGAGLPAVEPHSADPAPAWDAHRADLAQARMDRVDASAPSMADELPLSFMARSADAVPPQARWKAVLWMGCAGLLAMLLLVQGGLAQRDTLAAQAPALRPLLQALCEALGCVVSAPRQIDAIAIESSAFTSLKPGVYLLNLTLKSSAATPLVTPALELTLTDSQDRALLRKVIQASEFSAPPEMAALAELTARVPLRVEPGVPADKIAGYKLLAFYP